MDHVLESRLLILITPDTSLPSPHFRDECVSINPSRIAFKKRNSGAEYTCSHQQSGTKHIHPAKKNIIRERTMKIHKKVIEILLPHHTRRRRYYDLGRAGGKILRTRGYHAFHQSVACYLHKSIHGKDYQKWIEKNEPTPNDLDQLMNISRNFFYRPRISILMPVWNTDEKWLRLALESVTSQVYDTWELCIVDGGSTKPHIRSVLNEYAQKDPRIKVRFLAENRGIAGNSNEALTLATGDYVGFLDHDDELVPFALYEVVKLLNQDRKFAFIYSDEDKIDEKETRTDPFFKPDWSPDMFLSCNYLCHFTIIQRSIIEEVGGFHPGYDGAQDYDLFLRATEQCTSSEIGHISKILYHWRTIPESVAASSAAKPYAYTVAKQALKDAMERRKIPVSTIDDGQWEGLYRIRYTIMGNPEVSIVIPTKDNVKRLKRCITSILDKTTYTHYEIVVIDNQSTKSETTGYYQTLTNNPKIKLFSIEKPCNLSAINNYAAARVHSPYIVFLNDTTEVITGEWLDAMLEPAQRKEVGIVGAKLYYPDHTIQHCGILLGLGVRNFPRIAGYPYSHHPDHCGYFGRTDIICNYSAVTGACIMIKKEIFDNVGGFDEKGAGTYYDIDLCLKIREKGYLIVYTPYAQLFHHEAVNRENEDTAEKKERFFQEVQYIREKWGTIIDGGDRYYNTNLTLDKEDFSLRL